MASLSEYQMDELLPEKSSTDALLALHREPNARWQEKPQPVYQWRILKLGFQSACLVVNLVGLSIIAITLPHYIRRHTEANCGLPTDTLLGNIGWVNVALESEQRFVDADPMDFDGGTSTSIWNEIYPSAWVWVDNPQRIGFGGGIKIKEFAQDASIWNEAQEGFTVAVMHEIHCVAQMKRALIQYRRENMTSIPNEHLDHCVEYLRQATMCHGDMTLERPDDAMAYPQYTSGWGDVHHCRDWGQVHEAISSRAIKRGSKGWQKSTPYVKTHLVIPRS
ncbi:uncharacterized protein LY89DRAFT_107084 [Mollisia scopiformis]|uniref:Uncharacterized protein n=1 Tax=Mollisia scopiformis TaxID=149040 RepID=A0A194X4Z3_MOLSC|nr:uncharacterized protein LY89DRAFT_107084 [Mollisia scopiformis]KUJ15248.1 hypothetical protein LY89DRAFT_107084 [Mollisia scopiformis]